MTLTFHKLLWVDGVKGQTEVTEEDSGIGVTTVASRWDRMEWNVVVIASSVEWFDCIMSRS